MAARRRAWCCRLRLRESPHWRCCGTFDTIGDAPAGLRRARLKLVDPAPVHIPPHPCYRVQRTRVAAAERRPDHLINILMIPNVVEPYEDHDIASLPLLRPLHPYVH